MHVSVPQCDVFGYFSIESEIVILIVPVDHSPKALQVGFSRCCATILSLSSLGDLGGVAQTRTRGGPGGEDIEAFGWAGGRDARQSLKDRATLGSVFRGAEAGYPFDSRIQRSGREKRLRCCDSEGAETEGAAHRTDELAEAQGGEGLARVMQ